MYFQIKSLAINLTFEVEGNSAAVLGISLAWMYPGFSFLFQFEWEMSYPGSWYLRGCFWRRLTSETLESYWLPSLFSGGLTRSAEDVNRTKRGEGTLLTWLSQIGTSFFLWDSNWDVKPQFFSLKNSFSIVNSIKVHFSLAGRSS